MNRFDITYFMGRPTIISSSRSDRDIADAGFTLIQWNQRSME